MKYIFFIFLLLSPVFSFPENGYMRAEVVKHWLITINDSKINNFALVGFFLVNNSNQRVLALETNGEPQIDGEIIKIKYTTTNPKKLNEIYARATVEVQYNISTPSDTPVPFSPIHSSDTLNFTPEIKQQAEALSSSSSLATIIALTQWVHNNLRYNISYLGKNAPASEVFVKREGVCVEYTNLLIAMLNSLGIKSRFVTGYALQNDSFQPHAWAEVFVANQTIALDPTFAEAGGISAARISMFYPNESANSENTGEAFDFVNVTGGNGFEFSTNVSVNSLETKDFKHVADLSYLYENKTGELHIIVSNPTVQYLLLSYTFNSAPESYIPEERLLLLAPKKTLMLNYSFNTSNIIPGYLYTIPFIVNIPGSELNSDVKYSIQQKTEEHQTCPFALFVFLFSSIVICKMNVPNAVNWNGINEKIR